MVELEVSPFLKAEDTTENSFVVDITNEGKVIPASESKWGRPQLWIGIKLPGGKEKVLSMNSTSQRSCVEKWGPETKGWIGKKIRLTKTMQVIGGVQKWVLYGTPG